ncbi:MAG: hypothetical protein K2X43_04230 [Hyphomonadaceae bacterium]|nr:hypothetical protein [Hyphomonadaceae bacterium]
MRSVVFDDQGELWDARSRRLALDLHASIAGEELVDYAIRNLGFVAAKEMGASLRISLRPSVVSPIAFSALLYWLHDRSADRVLISFCDREWTHEMMRSREEAVRRLMSRVDFGQGTRDGDFLQQELSLESLPPSSPLRDVLEMWRASGGKFDRERLAPLLERALQGRFVLAEAAPNRPSLLIKDIGSGLRRPAHHWLSRSIGLRVEDQPDYAYGKWVAGTYRDVLNKGEPDLGDVDAVIRFPQEARQSFRYKRLLVPFTADEIILCASLVDPDINLRVKPRNEVGNAVKVLA